METRVIALREVLGDRAQANAPLATRTTFRVGGPADVLVEAKTRDELIAFVRLARVHAVPIFILGNGSNILVRDQGIRGCVIENHCAKFSFDVANAILQIESGASLPGVANRMARQGWSGLEWAIGVPGTFGGAIVGNAGAHGSCIADNLTRVTILDAASQVCELPKMDCALAYRTSRFKRAHDEIVLSAEFVLQRDEPAACIARMNEYTERRRRTQPTEASVGSMFQNPPGDYAGRLIEQAGLKGMRVGQVEVSPIHANFFVNHGGATGQDVLQLIELVRAKVREKFGIALELEIQIIGD